MKCDSNSITKETKRANRRNRSETNYEEEIQICQFHRLKLLKMILHRNLYERSTHRQIYIRTHTHTDIHGICRLPHRDK